MLLASVSLAYAAGLWRDRRTARHPAQACCWLSSAVYSQPLAPADARKWQALEALGVPLHVIGVAASQRATSFTEHAHLHLLPRPGWRPAYIAVRLLGTPALLATVIHRYDIAVVIAQGPVEGAIALLTAALARLAGRRVQVVVESHGDVVHAPQLYRGARASRTVGSVRRRLAQAVFRRATAARAVSRSTAGQVRALAPDLHIELFPAWIDSGVYSAQTRAAPPSYSHVLLFAGLLAPVKGPHLLVEATARLRPRLPGLRVIVAGAIGDAGYATHLRDRARALGLGEAVQFVGPLTPPQLAATMACARLVVLPSLSEGMPRVALEAMLVGTPVLAARVGGLPEIVQPGETGYLVPPDDVDALAEGLWQAWTDPGLDQCGARAQAVARQTVSVRAYVDGHRRLLAAATGAAPQTAPAGSAP